jgi:hypothetical protein
MGSGRIAVIVLVAAAMTASASSCAHSCITDSGEPYGVAFVGTVGTVADDGSVTLHVESVDSVWDRGTIPQPPAFGITTPATATPAIVAVSPGATVTVQFPKVQVDHLRRDIGKRYRVDAWVDKPQGPEAATLAAELNDMDRPCGDTRLADD